jgi:hypothetical protein
MVGYHVYMVLDGEADKDKSEFFGAARDLFSHSLFSISKHLFRVVNYFPSFFSHTMLPTHVCR